MVRGEASRGSGPRRLPGPAPGRHLGERSVSPQRLRTHASRLAEVSDAPRRFTRPASTSFEHYDTRGVGWKYREPSDAELASKKSIHDAHYVYDTARFGLGNQGHTFGDKLKEDERMDLIEYLKGL